jgi:hypothetical protein
MWNAGTMTTKGNLVFQGRADGEFVAYNAATGDKLWSVNSAHGISAPPITYTVDGKQYVSLLVGWGGSIAAPDFKVDDARKAAGCSRNRLCHGGGAVSGGYAPDLRASPMPLQSRQWSASLARHAATDPVHLAGRWSSAARQRQQQGLDAGLQHRPSRHAPAVRTGTGQWPDPARRSVQTLTFSSGRAAAPRAVRPRR